MMNQNKAHAISSQLHNDERPIQPIPSLEDKEAVQVVPTTGDKLRRCEKRIQELRARRWQALSEIAFQKAQLEAIDTDLTNQENHLLYLEQKDQDERYGVPE